MAHSKGVVLYDFMLVQGGAEKLTLALLDGLPDADLVYGFRDRKAFPDSSMSKYRQLDLGAESAIPGWRSVKVMRAFAQVGDAIRDYDWAIFSGSNAPLAVHSRPGGRNYYYCHTIPRFAYDLRNYYRARYPFYLQPALSLLAHYVRQHYEPAIAKMDKVIANSQNVRKRLRHFLNVDAQVVNPPIDTEGFRWLGQGDYYLSLARHEPFKRVELLVDAFRHMPDKKIVIASGGTQFQSLKERAHGTTNIMFTGWIDEKQLQALVGNAIACLYIPIDEDFGMSPVESMAAGKPVIGAAEGGLLETIVDGETGILLAPSFIDAEHIIEAVGYLDKKRALAMRNDCEARARNYSNNRFIDEIQQLLSIN